MDEIAELKKEIELLKERNRRVEAEKGWETSYTRVGSLAIITYIVAATLLATIGVAEYLLAALVPVFGFILSTLSLPALKERWMR